MCRVDSEKQPTLISFIQSNMLVKSGVVCDVSFAGQLFKNVPFYEREEKSVEYLPKTYSKVIAKTCRVGLYKFSHTAKLVMKFGESKAGLLIHYI